MRIRGLLLVSLILFGMGCAHDRAVLETQEGGVRIKGSTLSSRISMLIANGQFAEAEALIVEGTASGLLSKPQAALFQIKRMLDAGDFSLATEAQLRMAKKLLENPDRLMDKVR
jgi:hypothetical protein